MRASKLLQNKCLQTKNNKKISQTSKHKRKTQILLQKRGIDSVIGFLLGYFSQAAANLERNTSHGREILCFLGRMEKSLENMKYSQTKLRPESFVKEMDYAVKTRSWHTILGL